MDAGESENAKDDPGTGRKGKAGDQNPAKQPKRSGKAERQKGAPKAKDSQGSWVKKGEADGSEEEQRPDEPQRKGRAKAKSKAEAHGEGKKESWKEKRGKQQDRGDGDSAEAGKGRKRGGVGNAEAGAENSLPSGGALLSLLKANPPSVTRYTREELLAIGQLPGSKVKPSTLDPILDKENGASPIVMRVKADKASHRHRAEGEDDYDEEAAGVGRRERRQRERRGEHDEEDHGDRHRNQNRWGEEQQHGGPQRWKEEELQQRGPPQAFGKGGRYDEDSRRDAGAYRQPADQWAAPKRTANGDDGWDMPDSGSNQAMDFFTLGDIRQADKAISKGMSMSDYKASLRTDNRPRAAPPLEPLEEARGSGGKDRSAKDSERNTLGRRGDTSGAFGSPFGGPSSGGFFAEEDEDVSQASRGFGKWFGRGTAEAGKGRAGNGSEGGDLWDMPAVPASSTMALPPGMLPQDKSKPSPSMSSHQPPRSPEAHPVGVSSILGLLEESPGSKRDADAFKLSEAFGEGKGSQQGKSILSMIGRTEAEPAPWLDPAKQGKLSVAELFHLAQGKELPSMPTMNSNSNQKDGGGGEESAEQKMQREALAMASNFMWLAQATKAGQPSIPPGSRFPGYQQQRTPAPYGAMGPAGFGMPHPGASPSAAAMAGCGTAREQQLYAEAYAQAMAVGRGAGLSGARGGPKGAQASWPSPPGPQGYPSPYAPSYGSQLYGGYPTQNYSQLSHGMGGFDGSNAQGYNAQLAAMHRGYVDQGIQEGFQNPKGSLLEKGGHVLPHSQATSAGATLATATASAEADRAGSGAQLLTDKSSKEEANGEDDDGCAQS